MQPNGYVLDNIKSCWEIQHKGMVVLLPSKFHSKTLTRVTVQFLSHVQAWIWTATGLVNLCPPWSSLYVAHHVCHNLPQDRLEIGRSWLYLLDAGWAPCVMLEERIRDKLCWLKSIGSSAVYFSSFDTTLLRILTGTFNKMLKKGIHLPVMGFLKVLEKEAILYDLLLIFHCRRTSEVFRIRGDSFAPI